MLYEKGTFVIVPNKNYLKGQKPIVLAVFFWLCSFSDEYGECFPSRQRLADDCCVTVKTIDGALKKLEELCLIQKIKRKKKEGDYQSNLYQIICLNSFDTVREDEGVVEKTTLPSVKNDTRGSVKNDILTIPNTNYNHLTHSNAIALQGIPLVIEEFTKVNQACKDFYGNTTQRRYTEKLITTYGQEIVLKVVKMLPQFNAKFYNKATTPKELWDKWAKISAEAQALKQGRGNKYQITKVY